MRVLKFGETSVGSPESMRRVAAILESEGDVLVALSAISGTTNRLSDIAQFFRSNQEEQALKEVDSLKREYAEFAEAVFLEE